LTMLAGRHILKTSPHILRTERMIVTSQPECFGQIEKVFPMGLDGLREVSAECWPCVERVECLRQAVASPEGGDALVGEMAKREQDHTGGVAGFFKRWSRLKSHSRRKED
jgi:hypothetical protein